MLVAVLKQTELRLPIPDLIRKAGLGADVLLLKREAVFGRGSDQMREFKQLSVDRVVDHGIYIVIFQGMVVVKRIQLRRDGTLVLKSDNPHYDEEQVPPEEASEVRIAGRVRWFGRTI